MVDVAKIRIAVDADASGVTRGMAAAATAVSAFETKATRSFSRVTTAFGRLSTSQKALGGLGIGVAALGVGLAAVIAPAIQFESAFAGVLKTVSGTPAQLDRIRTGLVEMSREIPTTAAELAGIAENAGQLGIAAPDILEFTKTVALLGETTDLDFDSAAQSLARFLNVTGNDASISQLGDVIVELGNNAATTESQIVTFGTRLAASLEVAGFREDEILALGSAFSSMGVEAESGASALSRIVIQINDAAKLGGGDLRTFAEVAGLTQDAFAQLALEDPAQALVAFAEGLGEIQDSGRSITPVLQALELDGIRTSRVLQLMALNSDLLVEQLGLAENAFENGGQAAEEAARRFETTASRLEVLRGRIVALAIDLGTPALGAFALTADRIGDALVRLQSILAPLGGELADLFGNAAETAGLFYQVIGSPVLQVAAAGLAGLAGILSGLLSIFNSLGQVGIVIAGLATAIAVIGPTSIVSSSAVLGLAGSITFLGGASGAASLAVAGLQRALAAGPFILAAAALVSLGKSFVDAQRAADEAGESFRSFLSDAIDEGSISRIDQGLARITARADELREIDRVSEGLGGGWESWGTAIKSVGERLSFGVFGNSVAEARAELEAIERVLEETQAEAFVLGIDRIAERLDVSSDAAGLAVARLGLYDAAIQAGTLSQQEWTTSTNEAVRALEAEARTAAILGDDFAGLTDKLFNGTASMDELTRVTGITANTFANLAALSGDFDFQELLDPETQLEAVTAAEQVNAEYERMANVLGQSVDSFTDAALATRELASAQGELESAIRSAADEMLSAQANVDRVTEAQAAYNDAVAAFEASGTEDDFRAVAEAASFLALSNAAVAESSGEALAKLANLQADVIALGESGELSAEEISELGLTITALPEERLLEIFVEAGDSRDLIAALQEESDRLVRDTRTIVIAADGDQAFTTATALEGFVAGVVSPPGGWVLPVDADTQAAINETAALEGFVAGVIGADYTAILDADGTRAEAETDRRRADQNAYAAADYGSFLTADGSQAEKETNARRAAALGYATTYWAILRARNLAGAVIASALAAVRSFGGTRTVTLRTRHTEADGGILYESFDDGGISPAATVERPGRAQIYRPAAPYRVFAEPETGGEGYVPLAQAKRAQSIPIWFEIGRILGTIDRSGNVQRFHEGGISAGTATALVSAVSATRAATTVFAPEVRIQITAGSNLDESRLARLAAGAVRSEMDSFARQLSSQRWRT